MRRIIISAVPLKLRCGHISRSAAFSALMRQPHPVFAGSSRVEIRKMCPRAILSPPIALFDAFCTHFLLCRPHGSSPDHRHNSDISGYITTFPPGFQEEWPFFIKSNLFFSRIKSSTVHPESLWLSAPFPDLTAYPSQLIRAMRCQSSTPTGKTSSGT